MKRILLSLLLAGAGGAALAEPAIPGQDIYEQHCAACHAPANIMVASPKLHNRAQWAARLDAGFDVVLQNGLDGINAMPPMGACEDCTPDDIEAAIRYMAEPALTAAAN